MLLRIKRITRIEKTISYIYVSSLSGSVSGEGDFFITLTNGTGVNDE